MRINDLRNDPFGFAQLPKLAVAAQGWRDVPHRTHLSYVPRMKQVDAPEAHLTKYPPTWIQPADVEAIYGEEWAEWMRMSPSQRWVASNRLWDTFTTLGGRLSDDADSDGPVRNAEARGAVAAHGRPSVHPLRRLGV